MYIYLCLFLMAVPSLTFYFSGNEVTKWDLKNFFAAFSLGNVGAQDIACNFAEMVQIDLSSLSQVELSNYNGPKYRAEIPLRCPYGELDAIDKFG